MSRELKVYNRFDEMILHLQFVYGDSSPLQIIDGTPEMQAAVRALAGQDFDLTVVVNNQHQQFTAKWGSPEYIDTLAGYWSSNFGWRTRTIDNAASIYSLRLTNMVASNLIDLTAGRLVTYESLHASQSAAIYVGNVVPAQQTIVTVAHAFSNDWGVEHPDTVVFQHEGFIVTKYGRAFSMGQGFTVTTGFENDPRQKPSEAQVAVAA